MENCYDDGQVDDYFVGGYYYGEECDYLGVEMVMYVCEGDECQVNGIEYEFDVYEYYDCVVLQQYIGGFDGEQQY